MHCIRGGGAAPTNTGSAESVGAAHLTALERRPRRECLCTGDFGNTASSWACELTHPRSRPTVALWYLLNKYGHAFTPCGDIPAALQVPDGNLAAELLAFMAVYGAKTTFILYPGKAEQADVALEARGFAAGEPLLQAAGAKRIVHLQRDPRWQSRWYKDGIHPTPEGNQVLAQVIFDALNHF